MKQQSQALIGNLACFTAYAIFGFNIICCKNIALDGHITPMALFCLRAFGATALFWIWSLFTAPKEQIARADIWKVALASFLGLFMTQLSFLFAITKATAIDASITLENYRYANSGWKLLTVAGVPAAGQTYTFDGEQLYYTDDNHFQRGMLGYLPYFINALYLAYLFYRLFRSDRMQREDMRVLIFVVITAILCLVLPLFYYNASSLWFTMTIAGDILLYYVFLLQQFTKRALWPPHLLPHRHRHERPEGDQRQRRPYRR